MHPSRYEDMNRWVAATVVTDTLISTVVMLALPLTVTVGVGRIHGVCKPSNLASKGACFPSEVLWLITGIVSAYIVRMAVCFPLDILHCISTTRTVCSDIAVFASMVPWIMFSGSHQNHHSFLHCTNSGNCKPLAVTRSGGGFVTL